ncbi:MAG: TetR family transcriptional regulator C-terminal domain-containing protein [Catalinimonas sp.]
MLDTGERPPSIYKLAKKLKISEGDFYEHYNSFEVLERDIWRQFSRETHQRLHAEEVYATYSVREKLLAYYYTFVEVLKEQRSYVLLRLDPARPQREVLTELQDLRDDFRTYARELVREGEETQEIAQRPYVTDRYPNAFWNQLLFVLRFWRNDDSRAFEKTDAAIEKAVTLAFDVIGRNSIDSAFDFARFVFQNRRTVAN